MAVISVQELAANGAIPEITFSAASTADEFSNDGKTIYLVNNGSGGSINASFTPTADLGDLVTESAAAQAIGAGEIGCFGPFDQDKFNAADGNVDVVLSSATSVTVAAIRMKKQW